ncbi:sialidase family protein [Azospira sp. I13]|uniref:sialidase family protein n=1 Tax=Azospira sp. I13 TaxID=1765050 RepID=UPI000D598565|nr:sialidase family protein [Azospira sp. I13]
MPMKLPALLLLSLGLALLPAARAHEGHGEAAPRPMAAATPTAKPSLAIGADMDAQGGLWVARVEAGWIKVSVSRDGGRSFSAPVTVNREVENIYADGENRPKLRVLADGTVYVSYTRALAKPYSGMIRFAVSRDGGRSFSAPVDVNDDGEGSHRFDALLADEHGTVVLAWLDKREGAAAAKGGKTYAGSAVYYALSQDGGRTFAANRKLADHSCDCCRIGLAWDRDGTPLALWRQIFGRNTRDFALARLPLAPDQAPEAPQRASDDNWAIDACPHHGGDLAVDARGRYHLLWFTLGSTRQGLFYRHSDDGGRSFSAPVPVGDPERQAGHPALLLDGKRIRIVWRDFAGNRFRLLAMTSNDGGDHWQPARVLSEAVGPADYPRPLMTSRGGLVLWHTAQGLQVLPLDSGEAP